MTEPEDNSRPAVQKTVLTPAQEKIKNVLKGFLLMRLKQRRALANQAGNEHKENEGGE